MHSSITASELRCSDSSSPRSKGGSSIDVDFPLFPRELMSSFSPISDSLGPVVWLTAENPAGAWQSCKNRRPVEAPILFNQSR